MASVQKCSAFADCSVVTEKYNSVRMRIVHLLTTRSLDLSIGEKLFNSRFFFLQPCISEQQCLLTVEYQEATLTRE